MRLTRVFDEARATLGLDADADATAIRKAWRRAALECPPDKDPDGFRRKREAYELLNDPISRAEKMLFHAVPLVDPPPVPDHGPAEAEDTLPMALLRAVVGSLPAAVFQPAPKTARPAKTKTPHE